MRIVTDADQFLADPIGAQLVTRAFAYYHPRADLTGFTLWGCPDTSDIALLNRVMDVVLIPNGGRHESLVDMGLLKTVDPLAFRNMADYLTKRWDAFGQRITRQALVRPGGFSGAVVAGFYEVVTPAFPVKLFADLTPALDWLEIPQSMSLRAATLAIRETATYVDPSVSQLRALLRANPERHTIVSAARELGMSVRSLQRKLTAADSSFRKELQTAKLEAAQTLMLAGGVNLTRIALELGYSSLQHFSSLFRKHYGRSPSDWLKQRGTTSSPSITGDTDGSYG